jgi:hypothetical protein
VNEATLIRFPYETLEAFGRKLLATTTMSEEEAATVIKVLLDTNLRGMDTHGINMLPFYVKRYKAIEHRPITVAEDKGAGCIIDGGNHTGQMTSMFALEKAMEKSAEVKGAWERAVYYRDKILPAMEALRAPADTLEVLLGKDFWPMPTYTDLMFVIL